MYSRFAGGFSVAAKDTGTKENNEEKVDEVRGGETGCQEHKGRKRESEANRIDINSTREGG